MVNVTITTAGTSGPRGNGWLSGTGAPASSLGFNGDFYLDTSNPSVFYGPKANGAWPAPTAFTTQKNNTTATRNPTTTDDASQGYTIGSIWINTSTAAYFVAESVTANAAVWYQNYQLGTTSGSAAAGNDSRITNALQNTLLTTKGDLIVALSGGAASRLGVGSNNQILTADSTQTTGVKWAAPAASGMDQIFPMSQGYGLLTVSDNPLLFQNVSGLASGTVFGARCWVPANTALGHLTAANHTAGTYSSSVVPNQLGIYDDTGTQLQLSPNDNTLWATAGWVSGAITTVPAQGTGRFVYILYILGGFSGVIVPYALGANDTNAPFMSLGVTNAGNKRAFYLNGQTGLPASFNPTTVGTTTGFVPLVGAY